MKKLIYLFLFVGIIVISSEIASPFSSNTHAYASESHEPDSVAVKPPSTNAGETAINKTKSGSSADYRSFPVFGSRVAVWFVAQLHLMFAAFILGVPIFAVTAEFIGIRTKSPRFDRMAKEFTKLTLAAFSTTAILGALLAFLLIGFYPKFMSYFSSIFYGSFWIYALLFFGETFLLYLYWYTWDRLKHSKVKHLILGILLNLFGISIMVIANSWVSFTMSPAGIDQNGNLLSLWEATANFTWMPLNIHRFIANICFGGAVVAAFAGFKFMTARTEAERAFYDWEGYIGNFIAISAFLALPFAGYLLTREIYGYNQQLGISLMGGFLSWLWIIQAVLIGILFMCTNYYLWVGMERIPGADRYRKYIKYLVGVLTLSFMIWATPHTLIASFVETQRMGGSHHPLIGFLGVMSAKNTAVNLMILSTFVSFLLYRRGNKVATVSWAKVGMYIQIAILAVSCIVVIFYGIYGYMVEAIVRVGFSVYQVSAVIAAIILIITIDLFLFRKASIKGQIKWGSIPPRSQYTLLAVAVTFTWLMGLMGFARSAIRQHWHVYGVLKDTSSEAYTPALGYAANVVSVVTIVFIGMLLFIFWIGSLGDKKKRVSKTGKDLTKAESSGTTVILLRKLGFAAALIGIFTLYSNSIPQLESKVPEEVVISTEGLTQSGIVKMGEALYQGKGNCKVCHKDDGGRGPNLDRVGELAAGRKDGISAKDYLMESLLDPTVYVVEGFGPIMPAADKPPISFTQPELLAIVAYLESLGGEVTVRPEDFKSISTAKVAKTDTKTETQLSYTPEITGDAVAGKEVFLAFGCFVCHKIEGEEERHGPNLFTIGIRAGADYIKESILDPEAKIAEGFKFKMPNDYKYKLSVKEFNDLMAFMLNLKG